MKLSWETIFGENEIKRYKGYFQKVKSSLVLVVALLIFSS